VEELFKAVAETIALGVEFVAVLIIAVGAVEAVFLLVRRFAQPGAAVVRRKEIWVRYAMWMLLALEFELGADIIRSSIAPSWDSVGKLGAIALIRTVLNYFLEKDIEKYAEGRRAQSGD
jgi:uncharacterized membrane protein